MLSQGRASRLGQWSLVEKCELRTARVFRKKKKKNLIQNSNRISQVTRCDQSRDSASP